VHRGDKQYQQALIIYKFIEAGMTSIYKQPDLVMKKLLKNTVKGQYKIYWNEIANTFVAGAEKRSLVGC
jgi:hypothetical protein